MGAVFSRKLAIFLKRGKIGPRLLLMTNRNSHTHFRLVPKSTTLDDFEGPLRTVLRAHFGAHHKNLNEDKPISVISVVKYFSVSVSVSFFTGFFRFSFVSVFANFSVSVSVSCIFQFQFPFPFQLVVISNMHRISMHPFFS